MTQKEAETLLAMYATDFPQYYKNLSDTQIRLTTARYREIYEGVPFQQVIPAYNGCVKSCEFPPPPAKVLGFLQGQTVEHLEPEKAKEALLKAVRNSAYCSAEEYKKLPAELQEVVSPSELREMAGYSSNDLKFAIKDILKLLADKQVKSDKNALLTDTERDAFRLDGKEPPRLSE